MVRKRKSEGGDDGAKAIDSILFKYFTRLIVALTVILIFLTLVQCTIKKPESPEWTTNFVLPVINKTYDMAELIRRLDQNGLVMDSLGNIAFTITEQLDTVSISNNYLTTPNISNSLGQKLGPVSITGPVIAPVFVGLATITGISASSPEDTLTIGQQSFDINNTLPVATTYTTATISSGIANVHLNNDLGASLDTVILEIWDIQFNTLLAKDTFLAAIPSGTSATIPIDFSGITISNRFRAEAHCHTPGGFLTQASTRGVSTELEFPGGLTVVSANSQIPAISKNFSAQANLAESDRIDTAVIASGNLQLSITNISNLNSTVTISIPDLMQGGQSLTLNPNVLANQNAVININLSGYEIVPTDATVPQSLTISAIADIPASAPNLVSVSQSDSFHVTATIQNLTFSSVSGFFDSVVASFNGINQSIDVPTGFDSIQMTSAILTLDVTNSINLPGDLSIQVSGDNGKNLNLAGAILASGGLASAVSSIVEPSAGNFLSPIPSLMNISGSVVFANGGYLGKIEANDFICATVTMISPLEIIIDSSQVQTDVEKKSINQSDISAISDHVLEARFIYNIISHLPVGAQVDIYLGPDSATLFATPQLLVNALQLPAAPIGAGGIVSDTISTNFQEVYLDSIDIKVLENDTLYFGMGFNLLGTSGQMVKLTANDYLTISGRIEVNYRFNGQF